MKVIYRRAAHATFCVKTVFGLKTAPDCRIYRAERMSALPDHMAAGTNPKAGGNRVVPVSKVLRRTVSAFLFTNRQPRPRGMSSLPAIRVAELRLGRRCRQIGKLSLSAFQSEKTWQRKS
jgi:hypothetical protein